MSHQWQLKIYLIISSSLLTKKKLSKNQNNIVKRITKPSQSRTPQATQSNSNFSANQSELRSVPNRRSSRNQNNEERNYRMNTLSKSGSKTSLLWINHQTIRHKKVLKCVYLNHVSFLIHKILQTN